MKKFKSDKRAYAIFRAGIAMDRLISAQDPDGKNAVMRWAIAWGISAKALPAKNLSDEHRHGREYATPLSERDNPVFENR